MSDQIHQSNPIVDPYQHLRIIPNPDGTITRHFDFYPKIPANPDPSHPTPVLSKDIPVSQSNNTWVRLYLPRQALDSSSADKLPLVVYYHGGGFVLCSADQCVFHDFCSNMASDLQVVVASVEYRLAPEHRLPAAYDDAMESLNCIKTSQDEWLTRHADFSNCFLMGVSAGGNIAYHVGLRAAEVVDDLKPLKFKGLILHHPFFGGVSRTGSELRLINDLALPQIVSDLMWDLSLPIGVDRDHIYCNPTVCPTLLHKIKELGWRVLVTGCDGDPLIDRQVELVNVMKEKGIDAVGHFGKGDHHGVEIMDPSKAKLLYAVMKDFLSSSMTLVG